MSALRSLAVELLQVLDASTFSKTGDVGLVFERHGINRFEGIKGLCAVGAVTRLSGGLLARGRLDSLRALASGEEDAPEPSESPSWFICLVCQRRHPGAPVLRFDEPYCQACLDAELIESGLWVGCETCKSVVHVEDKHSHAEDET